MCSDIQIDVSTYDYYIKIQNIPTTKFKWHFSIMVVIILKFELLFYHYRVMHPKGADWIANSVDLDKKSEDWAGSTLFV